MKLIMYESVRSTFHKQFSY